MSVNITNEDINDILGENIPDNISATNTIIVDNVEAREISTYNLEEEYNDKTNDVNIKILSDYGVDAMVSQRYSGAPWFDSCSKLKIELIGAGGISSWTALALSRLNLERISIYDFDIVSTYNIGGQFYGPYNVGGCKAFELANNIRLFSPNITIYSQGNRITSDTPIGNGDIIISGVDSMLSRTEIYNNLKSFQYNGLYIDGRLSADTLQVISFMFDDKEANSRYKDEFLFNDRESEETVCSFKQTTYMAMMIASIICNIVVNYANNKVNLVEYKIPFFTEYKSIQMSMEVTQ